MLKSLLLNLSLTGLFSVLSVGLVTCPRRNSLWIIQAGNISLLTPSASVRKYTAGWLCKHIAYSVFVAQLSVLPWFDVVHLGVWPIKLLPQQFTFGDRPDLE